MIYIKVRVLEVRISLFSNHTLKNNAQLSGRAAVGHTVTDLEAAHKKYILHRKTLIFLTKLCTRTTFSSLNIILILNVNSKNPEILNFIRKNLNYHKITNPGERDKLYTMPLKMKIA